MGGWLGWKIYLYRKQSKVRYHSFPVQSARQQGNGHDRRDVCAPCGVSMYARFVVPAFAHSG